MSKPLSPDDPCYWMLEQGRADPSKCSVQTGPKLAGCYICEDDEFRLMCLPLCYACSHCGGHVAADDCICDACGFDQCEEGHVRRKRIP